MPASWRAHCRWPGGCVWPALAVSVTTKQPLWPQDAVILNEPGRRMVRWGRREAAGTQHRGSCEAGAGAGAALSITALVAGEGKQGRTFSPGLRELTVSLESAAVPSCQ